MLPPRVSCDPVRNILKCEQMDSLISILLSEKIDTGGLAGTLQGQETSKIQGPCAILFLKS